MFYVYFSLSLENNYKQIDFHMATLRRSPYTVYLMSKWPQREGKEMKENIMFALYDMDNHIYMFSCIISYLLSVWQRCEERFCLFLIITATTF